jgi:hypothetical protein
LIVQPKRQPAQAGNPAGCNSFLAFLASRKLARKNRRLDKFRFM